MIRLNQKSLALQTEEGVLIVDIATGNTLTTISHQR